MAYVMPIVASMGNVAASGGYYVAMACGNTPDVLFAEPSTWTGSIGVIVPHYDASTLLQQKLGVKEDSIASHPLKGMGSFAKPMTPEEMERIRGDLAPLAAARAFPWMKPGYTDGTWS